MIALVVLACPADVDLHANKNRRPRSWCWPTNRGHVGARRRGQQDPLGGPAGVGDAAPATAQLQRDFELKAYAFDADVHEAGAKNDKIELPERPEEQQTAIGAALDDVLRREAGKRLLGVVLLSDGAQRAYAPRDLPPQTAAARLKHLGCPMFTFPLGQSRGLGEAQDVALKDLIVNPSVFVKNELTISGQVRVDGYVNVDIPVRVLFETAPGKMEVVAQQTIKATADGQLLPINLSYIPQTPGEYRLTLEAVEQPGELVTTNNRLSTFVQVLKGGLMCCTSGEAASGAKFIRHALDARDIRWTTCGSIYDLKNRPILADRFKPGKYGSYPRRYRLDGLPATSWPIWRNVGRGAA